MEDAIRQLSTHLGIKNLPENSLEEIERFYLAHLRQIIQVLKVLLSITICYREAISFQLCRTVRN